MNQPARCEPARSISDLPESSGQKNACARSEHNQLTFRHSSKESAHAGGFEFRFVCVSECQLFNLQRIGKNKRTRIFLLNAHGGYRLLTSLRSGPLSDNRHSHRAPDRQTSRVRTSPASGGSLLLVHRIPQQHGRRAETDGVRIVGNEFHRALQESHMASAGTCHNEDR